MNKLSRFLVTGCLMLTLTGCGFSVGKSANLGTGTVATNNFSTNNHQTVGSSSVESKTKGYASFDISKDGYVKMTTFEFQLPNGYTVESPAGIVDKTTKHVISYLVVYDADKNCVAEIFDGKLTDNWSSDTDVALDEIASILKDSKIEIDKNSVNSSDLIYENLYALYVDNISGENKSLQFFANQNNSDYAFLLYDTTKDSYIAQELLGSMQNAYLQSESSQQEVSRFDITDDTNQTGNSVASNSIENSTSDIDSNLVTDTPTTENTPTIETTPTTENTPTISEENTNNLVNNTLSAKTNSILSSLDTDYNKVNWGAVYSPFEDEGVVLSVTLYVEDGKYPYLILGITNLYNEDITFSGKGYAKGLDGSTVANVSCYETGIGSGNTVIKSIYCEDIPSGEIYWDNIELPKCFDEYAVWESDWALTTDEDGYYSVNYVIDSNTTMQPNKVHFMLLDEKGNIVRYSEDYNTEKGSQVQGSINLYKKTFDVKPTDGAMFVNPFVQK